MPSCALLLDKILQSRALRLFFCYRSFAIAEYHSAVAKQDYDLHAPADLLRERFGRCNGIFAFHFRFPSAELIEKSPLELARRPGLRDFISINLGWVIDIVIYIFKSLHVREDRFS